MAGHSSAGRLDGDAVTAGSRPGDRAHLVTAVGPAIAGVFFLVQRLRNRQNAFVAVMVGAGVVIGAFLPLLDQATWGRRPLPVVLSAARSVSPPQDTGR